MPSYWTPTALIWQGIVLSIFSSAIDGWTTFTIAKVKDSQKDRHCWQPFVRISSICVEVWTPSPTLQTQRWLGISHLRRSLSSSEGNYLLSPEPHDIRAQHPFLWKTWGSFTCRSLRKSYTTNYASKPRIIVPKHPSWHLKKISFVPIKSNRILLFAKKYTAGGPLSSADYYLHLSIHEIRSDHRVGPALWSFNGNVDGYLNNFNLELIKSTKNALGIAFWARFDDHWKLFDLSITETDASNNFPLIESGRINFDLKFKSESLRNQSPGLSRIFMQSRWTCSDVLQVILSPDTRILLNVDMSLRDNETIDIHYLDSDGTNFSPVTRLSIPIPEPPLIIPPELAFSADGSKFVMAMGYGGVSVWDIQSKGPLRTFTESPLPKILHRPPRYPQFSRVNLGKEILIFVEVCLMFTFWYPYLSSRWSESLAWLQWLQSCNHSFDQCNVLWDGRKAFSQVRQPSSGWTFLWSKREYSVCWTYGNTLRVGCAEKGAWSRMVDRGGVECPPSRQDTF